MSGLNLNEWIMSQANGGGERAQRPCGGREGDPFSDLREGQQGGGHRAGGRAAQSEDSLGRNEVVKGVWQMQGREGLKHLAFCFED